MTLQQFADTYKVKIKKDSCGDEIIPGKFVAEYGEKKLENHHHIFCLLSGTFVVYLNFATKSRFNSAFKKLNSAGATILLIADMDGFLKFDPENTTLAKLVLKIARIKTKRNISDEQRAKLKERFKKR